MYSEPLDAIPLWGIFLLTAAILAIAVELGHRFGLWRRAHLSAENDQPVGAMVGSVLGLVALVLGFTFSLAASRFDDRRQAVHAEATAIHTTYLRANFLPAQIQVDVKKLLREYVIIRLEAVRNHLAGHEIERSEAIQRELWRHATEAIELAPSSESTALFVDSLNSVIELHAKRIMVGIRSRIPAVIWIGVIGLAWIGMASLGYQSGISSTARSPAIIALVIAFSIVLNLITDLDRGQEGLLRVSQQSLIDVERSITATTP